MHNALRSDIEPLIERAAEEHAIDRRTLYKALAGVPIHGKAARRVASALESVGLEVPLRTLRSWDDDIIEAPAARLCTLRQESDDPDARELEDLIPGTLDRDWRPLAQCSRGDVVFFPYIIDAGGDRPVAWTRCTVIE